MKIVVKIQDVEVQYEEPQKETEYPRIMNSDKQCGLILEAIRACVEQAIKAYSVKVSTKK